MLLGSCFIANARVEERLGPETRPLFTDASASESRFECQTADAATSSGRITSVLYRSCSAGTAVCSEVRFGRSRSDRVLTLFGKWIASV